MPALIVTIAVEVHALYDTCLKAEYRRGTLIFWRNSICVSLLSVRTDVVMDFVILGFGKWIDSSVIK